MKIEIPGRDTIDIKNIVFDYNGTLATDGAIPEDVGQALFELSKEFALYVLTADTYGSAAKACENYPVTLKTFPKENAGEFKAEIVKSLNANECSCIGNGYNDLGMFEISALSVAVLGEEGACAKALLYADIAVTDIRHAIKLFLKPARIIADLRN